MGYADKVAVHILKKELSYHGYDRNIWHRCLSRISLYGDKQTPVFVDFELDLYDAHNIYATLTELGVTNVNVIADS